MLEINILGALGSEKMRMRGIKAGCITILKSSNNIGRMKKRRGNPPSCGTDSVAFLIYGVKDLNPGLGD
jgi:hypothetical protein